MRTAPLAVVAIVAALLGGASALAIGRASGWLGAGGTRTVLVGEPSPGSGAVPALVAPTGKPLAGNGFDPAQLYARRVPGVVTIFSFFGGAGGQAAQGSGFVVSRDGVILTNSHVVTNAGEGQPVRAADKLYVEFSDHDRVPAKIVGWDVFDDVGVIRVDPKAHALAPVPLGDSARVVVGEPVAAIGSPFGNENSLAVGVVSATRRSISSLTSEYRLIDAIQTDAPINHGNSGGPLFDARGRVVGINAQIRTDSSGSASGVGFAVPIDSARRSMQQLLANGRVAYAYVGITTEDLTPTVARRFGYSTTHGALVDAVRSGSPGAKAGIRGGTRDETFNGTTVRRGGDLIVGIDGMPVRSADDVVRIVTERLLPGQTVKVDLIRGARRVSASIHLVERPAAPGSG